MKSNTRNIEKRIEDSMHALDNIKKVEPKPFLYTRIKVKMNRSNVLQENYEVSLFNKYATICIIIVLIFFNILIYTPILGPSTSSANMDIEIGELQMEHYSEVITMDKIEQLLNE